MKVFTLPPGREVQAALDTIREIESRGKVVYPCVLLDGLRRQLGAAGARELLLTLMESGAVEVDAVEGVRLTPLGEALRVDVGRVFRFDAPANDVRVEREGHA